MFGTIRHEGFHQYLDRLADDPPIWINEGMAEYFELADLYGGEWKEGQVNAHHVGVLTGDDSKWLALRSLFDLDIRQFQADPRQNYAESWAVVHYLRQGPKAAQDLFKRMWAAVLAGRTRAQIVEEC